MIGEGSRSEGLHGGKFVYRFNPHYEGGAVAWVGKGPLNFSPFERGHPNSPPFCMWQCTLCDGLSSYERDTCVWVCVGGGADF